MPAGVDQAHGVPPCIEDQIRNESIEFPVICKPLVACGTPDSHLLYVAFTAASLRDAATPCLIQQFHDHDGVVFKIYVIGDSIMASKRDSLPDLCRMSSDRLGAKSDLDLV